MKAKKKVDKPMSSIRMMVRGTYDLQKLRIQMGNRIVGNFKSKLGQQPSTGCPLVAAGEQVEPRQEDLVTVVSVPGQGIAQVLQLPRRRKTALERGHGTSYCQRIKCYLGSLHVLPPHRAPGRASD